MTADRSAGGVLKNTGFNGRHSLTADIELKVHLLRRVEGHADITATLRGGTAEIMRFDVVEAPRMFEVFLCGRAYDEVVHLASRVCGICAVSHRCAALKATEAAMGVEVSEQTRRLRRLAFLGEILSSHVLHAFFLVAPDLYDVPDVFHLADGHRDMVRRAMRLKQLAYDLCGCIAGRHTHPTAMVVGGFTCAQRPADLARMGSRLQAAGDDLRALAAWLKDRPWPEYQRETRYVSLRHPEQYAFDDGELCDSDGNTLAPADYRQAVTETVAPPSTAKHSRWYGKTYAVGALARFNNNYAQLTAGAKTIARKLGLAAPCRNPFLNTLAQVVESMHCLEEAHGLVESLLESGIDADRQCAPVTVQPGSGVGVVEAPRGTLFHEYAYDDRGRCTNANLVIPTAQNLANIEADMRQYLEGAGDREPADLQKGIEMLARAYDPCISCAAHVIELD